MTRNLPAKTCPRARPFIVAALLLLAGLLPSSPPMVPRVGAAEDLLPDPREMARVEASVDRALEYLLRQQRPDGSWPCGSGSNSAVNAFCLLAFLGRGHVPGRGPYRDVVDRAVNCILATQEENGLYRPRNPLGSGPMYAHALATLAMIEAYGFIPAADMRASVQKAVTLIVQSQSPTGGWRYQPVPADADLSVTVMQVVALRAAQNARLDVPPETMEKALAYVRACAVPDGGFAYQPGGAPNEARTAAGILSLALLGAFDDPAVEKSLKWLDQRNYQSGIGYFWYMNYYAMQAHFQAGGQVWADWHPKVRAFLLENQSPEGSWQGYAEQKFNGPALCYSTAIGALCLEVYMHYLPAYQHSTETLAPLHDPHSRSGKLPLADVRSPYKLSAVEPIVLKDDPADGAAVWTCLPGARIRFGVHYLVFTAMLLVPMTLTATLGTMSFSSADGTAIVSFWPAAAFQIVFPIWFGFYGLIAGVLGPMLGNALVGGSYFLYVPANLIQCLLPALWFRWRKLDPRLRTRRDWLGLIIVGCIAANALGALVGVTEGYFRALAAGRADYDWTEKLLTWFAGNAVPCLVLAPALLKAASSMIVRDPAFCHSFWGDAERPCAAKARLRFSDLPMIGKLMLLALVAGIVPLLIIAGLSVWETINQADQLAAQANRDAVKEMRCEIERHELLLRLWASMLDRPDVDEDGRRELLDGWRAAPEAFTDLDIVDLEQIEHEMPPGILPMFRAQSVAFYTLGDVQRARGRPEMRGAFRLVSQPDKVLAGLVVWRDTAFPAWQPADVNAVLVIDSQGNECYSRTPPELADWHPDERSPDNRTYTMQHAGQDWHVAEVGLPRLGTRFIALTSVRAGQALILAGIPNHLAILINLAIFGSLIGGSTIAQRISGRVLAMARVVRETGAQPGKLSEISVRGRDELGYLAETLNRMSDDLAESIRRLQEATAEKERLAAEMELARQVQMSILPTEAPRIEGYELAGACLPAREVGGDFFDYLVRPDGRMLMMIGDAVGKGLRAALLMTEAHAIAHAASMHVEMPAGILSAVNATMVSGPWSSGDFVTVVCALLDPVQHRLFYASAGHEPPILLRGGRTTGLELGGFPLAVEPASDYPLNRVELAAGDTLILYTDGVTDAIDTRGERFGLQRLEEVARRQAGLSAANVLDAVLAAVRDFSRGAPQPDDTTLLVLRRHD